MSKYLDVIILDDDPQICALIADILQSFYVWGDIHPFTDFDEALAFCQKKHLGVALFILDVYLGEKTAFDFLEEILPQYAWAPEDTIIITGNASDDIVNKCIPLNINYLIEKPMKAYTLKLAVRAIVGKYTLFAKRILGNPDFARNVANL
ncbi:MAG TPA: response regulator [Smithellaceae bacterium]|nr:response regulator [Smithellaceae bacterium]